MSTGSNTSLPSAHNIARYTEAISSNLGNLMSELARASASPPADNEAIMHQLRIITEQLTTVNRRLNALELASTRSLDRTAENVVPAELNQDLNPLLLPTPAQNNARAQLHNSKARFSSDALLPMRNSRNKEILGFPPTLGHLAQLNYTADAHLRKAFDLGGEMHALKMFCGVNLENASHAAMYAILHEDVALMRAYLREKRDAEIEAAGPPTGATRRAAATHNREARAINTEADCADYRLVPIHDERNIPVAGFPHDFEALVKPAHLADVLYFLEEYNQSTEVKGCVHRWGMFIGGNLADQGDCQYHTQHEWLW